ncbi:MAG TPA: CYTH domain-containing protein [Anaerolineae bacterium]|nr:CYTH domain-containing protein [Anaerolineae bacterium]
MMGNSEERLEVEVKFYAPDLTAVHNRLLALGAKITKPRVYERNVRFDTTDETLQQKWAILRLRQDTAVRLTYKGMPQHAGQGEVRVREELELEVSDLETMTLILERLGYFPVQVYEKYRETFVLGGVEIVLDEMPFGNFVELEGTEAAIKETAVQLKLDWRGRILTTYLGLMAELKQAYNLPFDDLTFANFDGLDVTVADILG